MLLTSMKLSILFKKAQVNWVKCKLAIDSLCSCFLPLTVSHVTTIFILLVQIIFSLYVIILLQISELFQIILLYTYVAYFHVSLEDFVWI